MSGAGRAARWLAVALLLAALLRGLLLVAHAPLAGYANQYDMARSSACVGLWPDLPPGQRAADTPDAPRTDYRYGLDRGDACYPSTAVAVLALALVLDRATEALQGRSARDFDLRQLGALYLLAAAGIAFATHRRLRGHAGWQAGHAVVVLLVLADPFNTLLYNTLYTEAPALLALYGGLALLLHLALGGRASRGFVLLSLLALLALGFSRVQHLLQPLALALPMALLLLRRDARARRVAVLLLSVATALPVLQLAHQQASPGIAAANRSNAVLGALLPASDDPLRMAGRLGLAPGCADLEHLTWYLRRGRDAAAECPGLAAVSLPRMAMALLAEPKAAAVLAGRGLAQATAWRLPYLGEQAGLAFGRLPHPSLADLLASRGFPLHALFWIAPALLLLARGPALLRGTAGPRALLLAACVGVSGVCWLSALLGDGYSELTRHLHLAQNAQLLAWALLLGGLLQAARRGDARAAVPPLAAAVAALLLGLAWLRLPLAEGVLEVERTADGTLRAHGWALDPSGVHGVALRMDGRRIPLAPRPAPDVARVFPLAAGSAPAVVRFDQVVEPPSGGGGWLSLAVVGGAGQESDADGLRLAGVQRTDP